MSKNDEDRIKRIVYDMMESIDERHDRKKSLYWNKLNTIGGLIIGILALVLAVIANLRVD